MEPQEQQTVTPVLADILTAKPTEQKEGKQIVFFQRKKVPADQLQRAVYVPAWEVPEEVSKLSETFAAALQTVISKAAGNILRRYIDESIKLDDAGKVKEEAKSIDVSLLTFDKVVAEMAAAQQSEKLESDAIKAWYDASKTKVNRDAAYKDEKKSAKIRDVFLSLASNNPGIIPSLAERMIGYIDESDLDSVTCQAIVKRLARIKQTAVSSDEL